MTNPLLFYDARQDCGYRAIPVFGENRLVIQQDLTPSEGSLPIDSLWGRYHTRAVWSLLGTLASHRCHAMRLAILQICGLLPRFFGNVRQVSAVHLAQLSVFA